MYNFTPSPAAKCTYHYYSFHSLTVDIEEKIYKKTANDLLNVV